MLMRFEKIITRPSGNTARGFNVRDLGNGRIQVAYVYTDRRRNHQVSRHFTAEFLNGHPQFITARSARGGRIERFSTSTIINELRSMISEFLEASQAVAQHRYAPAKVEAPAQDDTASDTSADPLDTVRLVGIGVVVNLMVTLVTLGIVWCNL